MLQLIPHAPPPYTYQPRPALCTCSIKSIKPSLKRLPHITHSRPHLRSIAMPARKLPHPVQDLAALHVPPQQSVRVVWQGKFRRSRQSGGRRSAHMPSTDGGRAEEARRGDAEG
jgi:hypothetical protein